MYYDVISASYGEGYKIQVIFEDGKSGVVDFQSYLQMGGVFEKFKDVSFFKKFYVNKEIGVLSWPEDIDVAPETLYAQATQLPLPAWMELAF